MLDHADDEEERGDDHAVVDHLDQRAFDPEQVAGEDAEADEPEVTHRGVGHQALEVSLDQRHEGAVEDAGCRQHGERRPQTVRRIGEQRQVEAQETVRAELRHQPGKDDHHRDRRGRVGGGQPGV